MGVSAHWADTVPAPRPSLAPRQKISTEKIVNVFLPSKGVESSNATICLCTLCDTALLGVGLTRRAPQRQR